MVMLTLNLVPLVLAGLLGATGAIKLFSQATARLASNTALAQLLHDRHRATVALRTLGALELVVALALLIVPGNGIPGVATAALGVGFLCYLGYARVAAPGSSCGCSARDDAPITWRAFTRAGLVAAGGVASLAAAPWWREVTNRPIASLGVVALSAAVLIGLSADLDRWWLLPLRRLRLRVFGHPLSGTGTDVPVAASVELLESSVAWHAASPVVRSALFDHWDDGGWRFLQFAGVYEADQGARPVTVVFAMDAGASLETVSQPSVRVTVIDDDSQEVVAVDLLQETGLHPLLPVVS